MTAGLDLEAIEAQAEILDPDEVAELAPARKSSSAASKLVEWFDGQDADSRFVTSDLLGTRNTRDSGTQPHDLDSLKNLAGQIRKYARTNNVTVEANAKRRGREEGILFERKTPSYQEGRGRKPASATAAPEAE